MDHCIVHDPPPADYDSRGSEDFLPSLHELECEMSRHLAALRGTYPWPRLHQKLDPWCGECYENFEIRSMPLGIEDLLLEEDAGQAQIDDACSCPLDSPNRDYFLKSLRRAYKEAS